MFLQVGVFTVAVVSREDTPDVDEVRRDRRTETGRPDPRILCPAS